MSTFGRPLGCCTGCGQIIWGDHRHCGTVVPVAWVPSAPRSRPHRPPKPRHWQDLADAHQRWLDQAAARAPVTTPDLSRRALRRLAKNIVRIDNVQHRTATVAPHRVDMPRANLATLYRTTDEDGPSFRFMENDIRRDMVAAGLM